MNKAQILSSFLQAIPLIPGKNRIGKMLIKLFGLSRYRDFNIRTKHGKFYLPNLKEAISLDLFINGAYEGGLVKFLQASIPVNGTFVDVGANIGSISIPLAILRPDVNIIAIEASPWIFSRLLENIELNKIETIKADNYAVYQESNQKLPIYAPRDLFGKGSLKRNDVEHPEIVDTITIDDVAIKYNIHAIDVLKVDVEGFEASVFKGIDKILAIKKPKIIFEFYAPGEVFAGFKAGEAQEILISKGFKLQSFDENFKLLDGPRRLANSKRYGNLYAFE